MSVVRISVAAALVAAFALPARAQAPTIADLEAAIAAADASLAARSYRPPAYLVNLPLAKLKLKKARLLAQGAWWGANADNEIAQGMRLLEMLQRGTVYQPPRSTLTELAYVSRNDETVQPFYVHIPRDYDPARPWPLIVFLHGYVPTISVLDPWVLSDEVCAVAERAGCLLVLPYARRNTDFQGVGEVDVFRVIEEMCGRFRIDPARIHLSGVSMGGMGTWTIALRNPGVFASVTPISGQTDMFRWWGWDRASMTPFKRFLVEWDNAEAMARNARGQQIFVQHGEMDHLISVTESRSMVERVRALDIPIQYFEFAGEGHYVYWNTPCYENAWGWAADKVLDPSPRRVTFRCYSLNYNRAFWLTIDRLQRWGTPADVDAAVTEDGSLLDIECRNVGALSIDLATCPLRAEGGGYRVIVNGVTRASAPGAERTLRIELVPAAQATWPPPKRKGLCGPAEDVFNSRFIVVQGTAGSAEQDAELARQVGTWAEEWDGFADGQPLVCTDEELSEEEIARSNLVLFGTPQTNAALARIAHLLPVQIEDHRYTVLGRSFEGDQLGLVLCYPNPLAPDHYVLIYAGELYGRRLSINHKHDMLPDFLIFDSTRFTTGDTEANVFGGWFDVDWQPRPELAWEGDEEPPPAPPAPFTAG
ncbi:MAG: prolyl oligopeptidase family serine peptidase [Armatimonadota bacterium]